MSSIIVICFSLYGLLALFSFNLEFKAEKSILFERFLTVSFKCFRSISVLLAKHFSLPFILIFLEIFSFRLFSSNLDELTDAVSVFFELLVNL